MTAPPPLVIIPGVGADARGFTDQITAISTRRSVSVLRLPGGDSLTDVAHAALDQMPPRAALAGHGLGGLVALQIATLAPDRVDRLALLGVDLLSETPARIAARDVSRARIAAGLLRDVLRDEVAPQAIGTGPDRLRATRVLVDMGMDTGATRYLEQTTLMARHDDMSPHLDGLRCPTLILTGRLDRWCTPARAEVMAARVRDATLCIIDDAGHLAPVEASAAVTAALQRWLSDALVLT